MFEKDEFVYWYDAKDLEEKIAYITSNFHEFEPMIEKAYNKAISQYTVEKFIESFVR
jgi:spore maturation protein CgeB